MGFLQNLTGSTAAKKLNEATTMMGRGYNDIKNNILAPYTGTGNAGNTMLANSYGLNGQAGNDAATSAFHAGPGYQFAMDQGIRALDNSAASRGLLASGGQMKALNEYGQGVANQEFGNWQSGLAGIANTGANTANSLANAKLATVNAAANNTANIGAAKTNAALGLAGGAAGLIGSAIKGYSA